MMGKKYDAYEKAVKAETDAKARMILDPTDQNKADAEQAEKIANVVFDEFLRDPKN